MLCACHTVRACVPYLSMLVDTPCGCARACLCMAMAMPAALPAGSCAGLISHDAGYDANLQAEACFRECALGVHVPLHAASTCRMRACSMQQAAASVKRSNQIRLSPESRSDMWPFSLSSSSSARWRWPTAVLNGGRPQRALLAKHHEQRRCTHQKTCSAGSRGTCHCTRWHAAALNGTTGRRPDKPYVQPALAVNGIRMHADSHTRE